tara:strand:+ start:88 stop:630 length:543 start_codon:yes stop_codon:yes gene_type:complete
MQNIKGKVTQRSASDDALAFLMRGVEVYAIDNETGETLFGPVYTNDKGEYELQTNFETFQDAILARYSVVVKATGQGEEPCYGTTMKANVTRTETTASGNQNIKVVNPNAFNILIEPDVCQSEVPVGGGDSVGGEDSVEEVVDQVQENTERTVRNTSMMTKALILIAVGVVGYYAYKKYK